MKKIYKRILTGAFILLFVFLIKLPSVGAASCRIGVSAPSSVVVGRSFNVTVSVSSNASIGSWEYTLSYDSSKVRLNGGSLHVVDYGNGSKKSASYSYSFTALTSGVATFKPVNASVLDYTSTNECLSSTGSASVTMKTQAEIEASYSRNNNLGSLSVEGAELSPAFDKSVTEYTATLPVDTTKAKVLATAEDSTASITGAGEIDVVDGLNKIEIVVTAQHGEKKTYVINLTVEELDPVKVKVNGKNYTVVRKSGLVENIPVGFSETKIKIENQEVAAYQSELTKLILVALKDNEGQISLFIYDKNKKTYTAFTEVKGAELNLFILDNSLKDVPNGFIKATFKHNNVTLNGYRLKEDKEGIYYLVYAQNLETGDKDFYLYDKKDGTFQRYYEDFFNLKDTQVKYLFYGVVGLLGVLILIIIIKIFKAMSSKEKKIKKYEKKINKLRNKINDDEYHDEENTNYDIDDVDERPVIKKVEDDEYVVPKKTRKQKLKEIEEAKKKIDKTKPSIRRVSLEDDDD